MKSMNSGTPASVAPPERSSFGMIRSTSTRTGSHSGGVKTFGSHAPAAPDARPAGLVDDGPAVGDAVPLVRGRHRGKHLTAHLRNERPERLLHVLHLLVLVVRPLPVEPQHRDAPPVHRARVDLAIGVVVRDHLAAARKADRRAVVAPVV